MYKILIAIIFLLTSFYSSAQKVGKELAYADTGCQEELCKTFSGILGYKVENLDKLELYSNIYTWLGTRYHYSGDSEKGIDCSGFVGMLYKRVYNVQLAGSSGEIFHDVKPLRKKELKEGDLVFFKIKKHRISHVGIYLSNNKFAHASVHEGVTISDLDEPYYKKYFYRGGRVLKMAEIEKQVTSNTN